MRRPIFWRWMWGRPSRKIEGSEQGLKNNGILPSYDEYALALEVVCAASWAQSTSKLGATTCANTPKSFRDSLVQHSRLRFHVVPYRIFIYMNTTPLS